MNMRTLMVSAGILLFTIHSEAEIAFPQSRLTPQQYFEEFVSPEIAFYPHIYQALQNVFSKLPKEVFNKVTQRDHPILFVPTISTGIARYARSVEFNLEKNKPRAFQNGFYLIMLGDELNQLEDVAAIEGVIFHEIAHRYLDHLRSQELPCDLEREANRLVKKWGFEVEYQKASTAFGHKESGDSPCHE